MDQQNPLVVAYFSHFQDNLFIRPNLLYIKDISRYTLHLEIPTQDIILFILSKVPNQLFQIPNEIIQ